MAPYPIETAAPFASLGEEGDAMTTPSRLRYPTLHEAAETCTWHLAVLVFGLEGVNDELYEHAVEASIAAAQIWAALQETRRP